MNKLLRQGSFLHDRTLPDQTGFQNLLTHNFFRTETFGLSALIAVWLLMALFVNPVGEFPLNDDWSYGLAVKSLMEGGRLTLSGFTSMPLIAQVLWGALFCLPFGFSFTALRISTIMLGVLGILATYQLAKEVKADHVTSLCAACVVAVNPLYFNLSLTFMTDVPFFTFSTLAVLFLLRALRTERARDLATGYGFAFVAILIRQLGIVIPLSFLLAYCVKNRFRVRGLEYVLAPSAAFTALLLALPTILRRTVGLPALYNRSYEPILEAAPIGSLRLLLTFADRILIEIIYLGFFLLPFVILLGMNIRPILSLKTRYRSVFSGLILFISMSSILLWQGRTMPLTGNVLFNLGLGPALLRDTYLLGLPHWPAASGEFWFIVTAVAVGGSVLLILGVLSVIHQIKTSFVTPGNAESAAMLFLLSAVAFYAAAIGMAGFLDRYLIWPLPLLVAALSAKGSIARFRVQLLLLSFSALMLLIFGLFAVEGTHDYLAWNQARWQALNDLMAKDGVSYKNIDGGFEFNGLYAYQAGYRIDPSKSPWWVDRDDYLISFGPVPGYVEMRRYPFERWLPPEGGDIFVLKRMDKSENGQAVMR